MAKNIQVNQVAEGLLIITKYDDGWVQPEHDEIFIGASYISPFDHERLTNMGWTKHDSNSYHHFISA